jgi:predicted methyltransferase
LKKNFTKNKEKHCTQQSFVVYYSYQSSRDSEKLKKADGMTLTNFKSISEYLASKGISFAEKIVFNDDGSETITFAGLNLTKEDQFFRCNGKIIAGNIAKALIA